MPFSWALIFIQNYGVKTITFFLTLALGMVIAIKAERVFDTIFGIKTRAELITENQDLMVQFTSSIKNNAALAHSMDVSAKTCETYVAAQKTLTTRFSAIHQKQTQNPDSFFDNLKQSLCLTNGGATCD